MEGIPVSKRLCGDFMLNTDKEYKFGLRYVGGKNQSYKVHYDSDIGWGIGLSFNYYYFS